MKRLNAAAVERPMKLQDVMLRPMAKWITWYQAAEILGIRCRQMQRWTHSLSGTGDSWDRYSTKEKVTKHEFASTGLVNCGHCGCALVAESKKGKYVYYHCNGDKGKCPEPYAREEVLEACFADLVKGLVFDDHVMDWIVDALHQSHADEKKFRRDALARLQDEQSKTEPT